MKKRFTVAIIGVGQRLPSPRYIKDSCGSASYNACHTEIPPKPESKIPIIGVKSFPFSAFRFPL